ncbi:succinate dehydrogenase assembly factor 2, mitochondrial [Eurytemora carolleeae]|uniref:succinate dehydrogenase assembly factor 2, mitochondrial n=1 Tax=Eurytemora carolleeae TaxID=1294199 RepID=UPI000C78353B|nr:succinate dehydrogenase assembly factor 2, mitochondrial [Eurytemora carolleeae]|eukprot:XP_023343979.1 succinate dehydrogenase assembly factor 2, mitochondrial-like [Eurytemora affinis]
MSRIMKLVVFTARNSNIGQTKQGLNCLGLQKMISSRTFSSDDGPTHSPDKKEPWIPEYIEKFDEPLEEKRARLLYQSRKRGMLENGLLLGSFAKKFLSDMDPEKLSLYDRLINLPSNDWEIYYWATETRPTPEDFDNVVMDMLKAHAKNENRESRISLPGL